MSSDISTLLSTLTPREAQVLKMRFGLDDHSPHTLAEIGQSLSLTREGVRQIEVRALEKLRMVVAGEEGVQRQD